MTVPISAVSGTVHVDAGTIDLAGESTVVEFLPEWTSNGLVEGDPDGDGARILTGQEIGGIDVLAQLWEGRPPLPDDLDAWQDVAELSVAWRSPFVDFTTTPVGDEDASAVWLPLRGAGDYRLRVFGRNRDDGDPRPAGDPVEQYLIQMWSAPRAVDRIIKCTSETARYWRK